MNFNGKVVLITGASSGIGAATALEFAKLGAELVLVGRNVEKLKETAEKCQNSSKHLQVQADMYNEKDVEKIMKETIAKFHKLDVLVNATGIIENGTIEKNGFKEFNRVMITSINSLYQLTMLAVPELKKTKGNIVSILSVCGLRSFSKDVAYDMCKPVLDELTKLVALELAPSGARCNSVNPGVIITEVHEVSGVICFLASDKASITGVNMPVGGGRHAMCPR